MRNITFKTRPLVRLRHKDITYDSYTNEKWKVITNFPNYHISTYGRVKNILTNKILKPILVCDYYKVNLYNNYKRTQCFVHKLVAEAFIDNIHNKPHVDHIDTNPLNNNVDNLRWCTVKENNNNPITVKKQIDRLNNYNIDRKRKVVAMNIKGDIIKDFESVLSAAKYVNTSTSNISKCCTKNNTDIKCICKGYYFRYV